MRCRSGSSPRVWGIQIVASAALVAMRFIPTRVGNTAPRARKRSPGPVHPHACGEYGGRWHPSFWTDGSSPRVWGIPFRVAQQLGHLRFIPTRVGNTCLHGRHGGAVPVHPHACGEYSLMPNNVAGLNGSSPRVWGIHVGQNVVGSAHRFIPTRVGNTLQEDARNNSLLAELQRATEPCVLQACSDDDKKGKELCKAAPSPRKTLPGRAVSLS